MAGPVLDLELQGGRWRLYRDPPWPPPVGVAVEGNGGDALMRLLFLIGLFICDGYVGRRGGQRANIIKTCVQKRLDYDFR